MILISLLACTGTPSDDTADNSLANCDAREFSPSEDQLAVVEGNAAFAADMYNVLEPGNAFFSPLSISAAFGMTTAGTAGNTETELLDTLHVDIPEEQWHAAFGGLLTEIESDRGDCMTELAVANRLFGQAGYSWQSGFLDQAANDYAAPLEEWDFIADPEGGREHINAWVEDQTNDKIKDLLPPNSITDGTRMVLANAIYFLGEWTSAFDPEETVSGTWRPSGASVDLMTMDSATFNVAYGDGYQALELPYGDEELAMVVLLPDAEDGLDSLVLTPEHLLDLSFGEQELDRVQLPRFEMTKATDLKGPMQTLGVVDAWVDGAADFSDLADIEATGEDLFISGAFHKAFIRVDEAGSEAAAATAVVVGTESVGPMFIADHPFAFYIRDTRTGQVLFLGRLTEPE